MTTIGSQVRFQYNNISYSLISDKNAQVGFGLEDQPFTSAVDVDYDAETIIIPSTVYYNNKAYTVTQIGSHAFFQCTKIKIVIISYTIELIGWSSLSIISLEQIIIPPDTRLREIGTTFIHTSTNLSYFIIPQSVREISPVAFKIGVPSTLYYCGMRKFSIDFELPEGANVTVHVSKAYPYESFGNLSIIKDDFCLGLIQTFFCKSKRDLSSNFACALFSVFFAE